MPYNYLGDLSKSEIVSQLREMGCNVKNVHELNLIMEDMGLQEHSGNGWITTEKGVGYTIYKGRGYNVDGWHSFVVDEIYNYLNEF